MLRMDGFRYVAARSPEEAVELWATSPAPMYVAGGTDLLPNLKHRIVRPETVIALQGLPTAIAEEDGALWLGAGARLDEVASHPLVRSLLPPLAQAAGLVASPQIRAMGTLGGNVMLDTRCLYYNQTEFWRKSLGYCLKAEGDWCHVVGGPKTCVAAQSSDTVPVLLALDASVHLVGPDGARALRIRDLYRFNGMDHLQITKGEVLVRVSVPLPATGFRGSYTKLRTRDSIDFPLLGLAVAGEFDGPSARALTVVVGAANPQPKPIRGLEEHLGVPLDAARIAAVADLVYKQTRPQASVAGDVAWKRQMAAVLTRRALAELATTRTPT